LLVERSGNSKDFSNLFVAIARNVGLSARSVAGIIFAGNKKFRPHYWCQVLVNHEWVSIDPVLKLYKTDATHIMFVRNEDDADIKPKTGDETLKVLSIKYNK